MRGQATASFAAATRPEAIGVGHIDGTRGLRLSVLLGSLAAATLATLALAAAPAHAGKGWAFKEVFGSANQPTFTRAAQMDVDDDGDLYVMDENGTLSRWNPDGTPSNFSLLGSNVIDGAGGADETPGGKDLGNFFSQVAVDDSGTATDGNIYVSESDVALTGVGLVNIFSSEGQFLGQLTESIVAGPIKSAEGVAVDGSGNVYVSDRRVGEEEYIHKFDPTGSAPVNGDNVASFETNSDPRFLAAGFGPTDGYFFERSTKRDADTGVVQYTIPVGGFTSLSVDPGTGHLFLAEGSKVVEYDVSSDTEATQVAELENTGETFSGIAVADGAETLYLTRFLSTTVEVYEAVSIPEVSVDPPSSVSGAKATVAGSVNPEGVEVVDCFFEYGRTAAYGQEVPCEEYESGGEWHELVSPAELGTGTEPIAVRGQLTGMLANGATHHYRLVARAAVGQDASEDETLVTADTYTTDAATGVTETEATLNGTVKLEGIALTDCKFEWGETADYGHSVPCDPPFGSIPSDDADHDVSAEIDGLEPSTLYHYRLVAENALGQLVGEDRTFFTQGAPRILEQTPQEVTQTTAILRALINPAGRATSYHFEWGPGASFANRIPATGAFDAGSGSEPVEVTADISGLDPVTKYSFRVVATNSADTVAGPEQPFETLNGHGLPNNRGYELVSPADKGPSGSVADFFYLRQLNFRASTDGSAFLYPIQNGIPSSSAGGWTRWQADRTAAGWLNQQVSAPSMVPPRELEEITSPSVVHDSSSDLGCAIVESFQPLTDDIPQVMLEVGGMNLFRRNADGSYDLISNRLPVNPKAPRPFGGGFYRQIEVADDCSRVYFRSAAYEFFDQASGLYEWEEGTLRDAGQLPSGAPGEAAVVGGETTFNAAARWHAVSPDGSRFLFSAISDEGADSGQRAIFMREDGGATVTDISQSQTSVPTTGARYEATSEDGGKVIFAANYGLVGTSAEGKSSAGPTDAQCDAVVNSSFEPIEEKPCDLYVYDTDTGELTDISVDANPQDPIGAAVQGVVAVDEDGSHVYFAALGQLVPGKGRTYAQNTAGEGSANVYLAAGGELSYVTTLNRHELFGTDSAGGRAALVRKPLRWSAETNADGSRLLFESSADLAGFDTGGAKAAYLYDSQTKKVTCISCRRDGEAMAGTPEHGVLAAGLRTETGTYRSRAMSEDGRRVFFSSPDVLAPGAEPGEVAEFGIRIKTNVYLWEEGQISFLAIAKATGGMGVGAYLDADAEGDTAFVATSVRLAPEDKDFVSDVYAIRVDGGFPFQPEPPGCQVNDTVPLEPNQVYCQAIASPQPDQADPSTSRFEGRGNGTPGTDPCSTRSRKAKALTRKAKALRRKADKASNRGEARRTTVRARRVAAAAKRNSRAASRCHRRARAANNDLGGAR